MDAREHPSQAGYIITFSNGTEYATQEGDQYYPETYRIMTGEEYVQPVVEQSVDTETVIEPESTIEPDA